MPDGAGATGMETVSGPIGAGVTFMAADTTVAIMGIIGMEIAITGREITETGTAAMDTGIGRLPITMGGQE